MNYAKLILRAELENSRITLYPKDKDIKYLTRERIAKNLEVNLLDINPSADFYTDKDNDIILPEQVSKCEAEQFVKTLNEFCKKIMKKTLEEYEKNEEFVKEFNS